MVLSLTTVLLSMNWKTATCRCRLSNLHLGPRVQVLLRCACFIVIHFLYTYTHADTHTHVHLLISHYDGTRTLLGRPGRLAASQRNGAFISYLYSGLCSSPTGSACSCTTSGECDGGDESGGEPHTCLPSSKFG